MVKPPNLFIPVLLLCISSLSHLIVADTYYVTPSENVSCPGVPCRTLADYADHPPDNVTSITMVFIEGEHPLSRNLSLSNVSDVTLDSVGNVKATINCSNDGKFMFDNAENVLISNLDMLGCYGNNLTSINHLVIENSRIQGRPTNSEGQEAFLVVSIQNSSIVNCKFELNEVIKSDSIACSVFSIWDSNMTLTISEFVQNYAESFTSTFYPLSTTLCAFHSNITIEGSTFTNNSAGTGGVLYAERSDITVLETTFSNNYAAYLGGASYVSHGTSFSLENCTFSGNRCGVEGGVIYSAYTTIELVNTIEASDSLFHYNQAWNNKTQQGKAGVMMLSNTHTFIINCSFIGNIADNSGTISAIAQSEIHIEDCHFSTNSASLSDPEQGGGAVLNSENNSSVYIRESVFSYNSAISGGCVYSSESSLYVDMSSLFEHNNATYGGIFTIRHSSTIYINQDNLTTCDNDTMVKFINNTAHFGGALNIIENSIGHIHCATFVSNRVDEDDVECRGGAILARTNTNVYLTDTNFIDNHASDKGGMLFAQFSTIETFGYLNIQYNGGHPGAIYLTNCTAKFADHFSFTNNNQSLFAHYSDVTFKGSSVFTDQNVSASEHNPLQGGAITALRSTIRIDNDVFTMQNNHALNGGGMLLTESTLDVKFCGECKFLSNSVSGDGGAIDAYQSKLMFKGNVTFLYNVAKRKGGAIFLWRSTIHYSHQFLSFLNNNATFGGAIYFDSGSALYILKETVECERDLWYCISNQSEWLLITFSGNSAEDKGGAIYVNDTLSTTCSSDPEVQNLTDYVRDECFIQALAVYESAYDWNVTGIDANLCNINFTSNKASKGGSILFGGLLDRCRVDDYAEQKQIWDTSDALVYFKNLSWTEFSDSDVTSDPVQICPCNDNFEVKCGMPFLDKQIEPGKTFGVRLAIVDQIGTPFVNGTVKAQLSSEGSRLRDSQQSEQAVDGQCNELNFTVFTNQSVNLILYPNGPCNDYGMSKVEITLHIQSECPLGFALSESSLECACDPETKEFIENCSIETSLVERRGTVWISNSKNDTGILAHKYCPYDYCLPPSEKVFVNLSDEHGSDAQCAFNRIGRLCGCCDEEANFSLTLGSSECKKCSNYSLFLIIPFGLVGIALVVLMMVCNLTLASGTISGLLFYSNILISNRFVFFPPQGQNFLTVFVSWLGVNLGIATCFYRGLDGFAKIWLQIAFEAYLIFLMVVVILLGRSVKVAQFFHKYNLYPVHTLATLIMLAYEKLSRKVFSLVAFTQLRYVDDTIVEPRVWLFDPCLDNEVKHVSLYVVASFIIITGIIFNFILLFNKLLIAKCKSVYFITFMESFHAPFKPKHQYWVGLLLLVRNISYFVSDFFNAGDNPSESLHFIFTLVTGLLLIKFFYAGMHGFSLSKLKRWLSCRRNKPHTPNEPIMVDESGIVYKNPFIDFLETSLLVNLLVLTYFTLYLRDELENSSLGQTILFNVSASIVFITFIGILIYHTCVYTCLERVFCQDKESADPEDHEDDIDDERIHLSTSGNTYGTERTTVRSEDAAL